MNPKISAHYPPKFLKHSAILMALLALALLGQGLAFAQTGPPPPPPPEPPGPPPGVPACPTFITPLPGTPLVAITFPAVPPAGILPVVGNGVVVFIPAAGDGAVAVVNTTLGDHLGIAHHLHQRFSGGRARCGHEIDSAIQPPPRTTSPS